jgi:hypothetical protein
MRDTVGIVLVGALWLSAILAIWVSVDHLYRVNTLQRLYVRQAEINHLNAAAQALATEAVDYSRKNPSIDPILQQFDLKPRIAATGTNQPVKRQ